MTENGGNGASGLTLGSRPVPFLEVRIREAETIPGLTAVCAGYEGGEWRRDGLVKHLFEWLPDFALPWSERRAFHPGVAVRMLRHAAKIVYASDKFRSRGEFGELILHAVIRTEFDTEPAISKLFYKDTANDTVKGFDCVHVVGDEERLELWLGEAKFYGDPGSALRAAAQSLSEHLERDYLRGEFILIDNKIDREWPWAERLRALLDPNTSLDEIFDALHIPVLVTYDSAVMAAHEKVSEAFIEEFRAEIAGLAEKFDTESLPEGVVVELIFLPLESKAELVSALDEELKQWQKI